MAECIPQGWSLVLPQWRSPAGNAVSSEAPEKGADGPAIWEFQGCAWNVGTLHHHGKLKMASGTDKWQAAWVVA